MGGMTWQGLGNHLIVHFGWPGDAVRRVQELLTLHGHGVVVDGDFGPATQRALSQFQLKRGLVGSGEADAATWAQLIRPMTDVLSQRQGLHPDLRRRPHHPKENSHAHGPRRRPDEVAGREAFRDSHGKRCRHQNSAEQVHLVVPARHSILAG
jgi:peptidoglycan hydrolase-like protein with peptidoglycan-binding domain